mmetsp:Transcript_55988/g.130905  ORF Transcript_55988/g.130905 Transcript_55988/m.130905 type:complete len:217 (-) Transcript_55988:210-860(-)
MNHQKQHADLRERIWKREVGNLACILQVHDSAGHLLKHARDNRRRHRQNTVIHAKYDDPLNPLLYDFLLIADELQILKTCLLDAAHMKNLERSLLLWGYLLQGTAKQQRHQPGKEVMELLYLALHLRFTRTESYEAAICIKPFSSCLLKQGAPLPPPVIGYLNAHGQDVNHHCSEYCFQKHNCFHCALIHLMAFFSLHRYKYLCHSICQHGIRHSH